MDSLVIFALMVVAVVLSGGAILLARFGKRLQEMKDLQLASQNDKLVGMLNANILSMNERIDKTTNAVSDRLDVAAKIIGQVQHELGGVKEIGRSISDFQAFLKSPKIRGNLGETILYDALDQIFSKEHYGTQFKFQDGQVVDAVLKTSGGLIPIDSKFPMEAFQRLSAATEEQAKHTAHRDFTNAVRKHVRDISTKYILPQEGTVNFAVMYVPSEAVYFEVVGQHEELYLYAQEQRVLLVSPHTFSHFLHVILMGIERSHLHEQAQQIWEILKGVQKETTKFGERLNVLYRHITNAKNAMETVSGEYTKLSGKVDQVKLLK